MCVGGGDGEMLVWGVRCGGCEMWRVCDVEGGGSCDVECVGV